MTLGKTLTAILLTTSMTGAAMAQGVGIGGSAGANAGVSAAGTAGGIAGASSGVNAGVSGLNANADTSLNVGLDAGNAVETEAETGFFGSLFGQGTVTGGAAEVSVGDGVKSVDGQTIGTVAGMRTTANGTAQTVIDVNKDLGLEVSQVAVQTASLRAGASSDAMIGMKAAELRESIQAQLEANASATAGGNASVNSF